MRRMRCCGRFWRLEMTCISAVSGAKRGPGGQGTSVDRDQPVSLVVAAALAPVDPGRGDLRRRSSRAWRDRRAVDLSRRGVVAGPELERAHAGPLRGLAEPVGADR